MGYRKGVRSVDNKGNKVMYDIGDKINLAVFPGLQGGPHNHAIAGIAVALKQANSEEFKTYQKQVVRNAQRLADGLIKLGDKSALNPSGVRLGTPALTTRGFKEAEMDRVVAFINSALKLAVEIQASSGPKLVDFRAALVKPENEAKLA